MATDKLGFDKPSQGDRWHAPAAARNRAPILDVLRQVMPAPGVVLEVASGSGQHGAWFAAEFPDHRWAPSDIEAAALGSIDAWATESPHGNVLPARQLDTAATDWPIDDIAGELVAIFNANMIHIAPWAAGQGLLAGAGRLLPGHGILFLYGPFLRGGQPASDSDRQFDENLRAQNPAWGLRDLDQVVGFAASCDLELAEQFDMPAGNLSLVFRRAD